MNEYNVNELDMIDGTQDYTTADAPVDEVTEVASDKVADTTSESVANESVADEVADVTDESVSATNKVAANEDTADDVNLADLVEQGDKHDHAIDSKKSPLFDNLTLFIIMMVIGFVGSIAVCHLFENWYLGFILGGYLGTALGLVALFIRKFGSKK